MASVFSADGTRIAYAVTGSGPPLVLVHGSTADHSRWATILPSLNAHFTCYAMDRRGRAGSGDAEPYRIEHEYEDVAAVVRAAGPGAMLLGHSFGALCAMEAALQVNNLARLVLYEPAFPSGDSPIYPPGARERLEAMLSGGSREKLLETFFSELVGLSDEAIAALRADPSWAGRVAAAHTAVRELADDDYRFDPVRFQKLTVPTLLLLGEVSPGFFGGAIRLLDAALPDARLVMMPGQGHVAMNTAPDLFLKEVIGFLTA